MSRFSVNRASSRSFQRIRVYEKSEIEEDEIIIDPESILADENITFEEEDIEFNYDHIKSEEVDKTIVKLGYGLDMFKKRKADIEKLVLDIFTEIYLKMKLNLSIKDNIIIRVLRK